MTKSSIIILLLMIILTSCNDEVANTLGNKPSALGRLNEIEVISDNDLWDGPLGDSIVYYFGSSYPIMPTPEAIFDMRHFSPNDLQAEPLRKELRTYVVVADLLDEDSPTTKMIRKDLGEERLLNLRKKEYSTTIGKDKWARNQILIYIMGTGPGNVAKAIRENFPAIAKKINEHDEEQLLASIYTVKRTNPGLENKVRNMFGMQMSVPGDFKVAVEDNQENILWLRKDDNKGAIMNILMQSIDYKNQNQFSIDSIKSSLNKLSGMYVKSSTIGSKMIINDEDLPIYDYTYNIDGQYTKELRGVWEMTDDFMAGPFFGYAINLKENNRIMLIYTFMFAPGKPKRNAMQQLEYIVKSMKMVEVQQSQE